MKVVHPPKGRRRGVRTITAWWQCFALMTLVLAYSHAGCCLAGEGQPKTAASRKPVYIPSSRRSLPLEPGPGVSDADLESVRQRLDVLPDHLFAVTHNGLVLRFQLSGLDCGRISDTGFCLQSLSSWSWVGRVVTHYPLGVGNLTVSHVSSDGFRLTSSFSLDVTRPNETISTGAIALFSQFLPPGQTMIVSRGELDFTCAPNVTAPGFPHLSLGVDRIVEHGVSVHRYRILAAHQCACGGATASSSADPGLDTTMSASRITTASDSTSATAATGAAGASQSVGAVEAGAAAGSSESCRFFNRSYTYASAMDEWEQKSPDHSGVAHVCFARFSGRLSIWAGIGVLFIALIWGLDVWLGVPLLACDSCCEVHEHHTDERSTVRGRCLVSSAPRHRLHPIGTARYIWTFGFLDVLTPPVNMLERRDSAWATAAGFGMMSLTIPFIFNGALEITQILEVLMFFTPMLLCRHARVPSIGLCLGTFFCMIALGEVGTVMGCLASYSSLVNFMAMLPSLLCVMLLTAWYILETKRRLQSLYRYFRGTGPRPVSWRERALLALDRSGYVGSLLANKIKVNLGESLTWSAFKATILGQDNYSVPTRLLTAVVLAICCLVSLLPLTMSYASLAGAAVEWIMSMGHCCSGVQCDPTPGASLWISDPFDLGYGIQLGQGQSCSRDQIIVRRAVSYGMTVSTSVTAVAVTFALLHVLVVYRKRMFLLFRGRPDFITKPAPTDKSIGSTLKFGGTQVASAIGGWVLGTCVLTLLIAFIAISTVLPFMNIYGDWFWPWWFQFVVYNHETGALGFPIILLINYWLLLFCVRFVFQISKQDHGLQRRGFFHLMDLVQFIFYILNALLGLIKRAITSMVLQAVFVSRMDKSLMPRKYELKDKSYVAYLGFMQLDYYYSHPVLLTAVYFFLAGTPRDRRSSRRRRRGLRRLWPSRGRTGRASLTPVTASPCALEDGRPIKKDSSIFLSEGTAVNGRGGDKGGHAHGGAGIELSASMEAPGLSLSTESDVLEDSKADEPQYCWRIRNRYWLAVTLTNNPKLRQQRGHFLRAMAEEKRLQEVRDAAKRFRHKPLSFHGMAQRVTRASAQVAHTLAGLRYHPMHLHHGHAGHADDQRGSPVDTLLGHANDGTASKGRPGGGDEDDDDDDDANETLRHTYHHYDYADGGSDVSTETCPPNTLVDVSRDHSSASVRRRPASSGADGRGSLVMGRGGSGTAGDDDDDNGERPGDAAPRRRRRRRTQREELEDQEGHYEELAAFQLNPALATTRSRSTGAGHSDESAATDDERSGGGSGGGWRRGGNAGQQTRGARVGSDGSGLSTGRGRERGPGSASFASRLSQSSSSQI